MTGRFLAGSAALFSSFYTSTGLGYTVRTLTDKWEGKE